MMINDNDNSADVTSDDIVGAAQNLLGSGQYRRFGLINGIPAGQAKDHQFIGDVLNSAGAGVDSAPSNQPSIADWADPSASIPGWPVVNGPIQAGDVLATSTPKPTSWYYAPGGQSLGIATGNDTSIGIQDNDRIRESGFGFQDGHNPVVRRYDSLSNPAQQSVDFPTEPPNQKPSPSGNTPPQQDNTPPGQCQSKLSTSVAANDNDGNDLNSCIERCSDLAFPTNDFGVRFHRCVAQCMGTNTYPEWEGYFQ